jgi:DNA polymerase-1
VKGERTLYLVDGTSQLFRAFFAIRGLTNDEGVPTGAVYGFLTMLRKLLQDEKPEFLAVAFDLPGPTFRHDRYAEYKAHRPPAPPDIQVQVPLAHEACEALRIPVLELPGYEADDLIATYARLARERGFEVVVVASDKDLLQLVGDGVAVLNPSKNVRLDAEAVLETFGVAPDRVRDVLGLMGDSVDNIPGVPGVGEKTALAMVAAYGSVEAILERAERLVATFDARDALLEGIGTLSRTDPTREEDARALSAAGGGLRAAIESLRPVEKDGALVSRLDEIAALLGAADAASLAGRPSREAARELKPLERALKDLEKGTSRKTWTAVHESREKALLSRELATLDRDVPVTFEPEPLRLGPPDDARLRSLYTRLAFRSLLADLDREGAASDTRAVEVAGPAFAHEIVTTGEALREIAAAARAAERIAVAVRARGGPMTGSLEGIALALSEERAAFVPVGDALSLEAIREGLAGLLADPGVRKVGHDLKHAHHVLRRHGLPFEGWHLDTMVAAFLLEAERPTFHLDRLTSQYLGTALPRFPEASVRGAQATLELVTVESIAEPAAGQAVLTLRLARVLEERLAGERLDALYASIDGPLLPVLARMEERGIRVDRDVLVAMSREMERSIEEAQRRVYESAGQELNLDSPKQLREVLFDKLGLKSRRRTAKGGELSTDAAALEELADEHEIARRVLEYRELAKLKGTYVDSLPLLVHPETGRVHTSFHPTGAATGRLSSSDPNLQNIPARTDAGRRIRSAFVPEAGCVFLASDYSQVELRVLAHLTGDPGLVAAFRDGEDIHRVTASRVFGVHPDLVTGDMRRRAKAVNFGILYGMSETRLARDQGMTRADARKFIHAYFDRFARVRDYIASTREAASRDATVTTLFGRVRRFPELRGGRGRAEVEQALRGAVNTTIQGTAADLMKLAMLRVEDALGRAGLRARMLLQVHDELLFEVPEDELSRARAVVREAMEGVHALDVPLVVDQKAGRSWMEVT